MRAAKISKSKTLNQHHNDVAAAVAAAADDAAADDDDDDDSLSFQWLQFMRSMLMRSLPGLRARVSNLVEEELREHPQHLVLSMFE